MIPVGVFNQGAKREIYSFNINGSYAESQNATSPLGMQNEYQILYTTNSSNVFANWSISPNLPYTFKTGFTLNGIQDGFGPGLYYVSKYSSTAPNNDRKYRGLQSNNGTPQGHQNPFMLTAPVGAKVKVHFWMGGLSGDTGFSLAAGHSSIYVYDELFNIMFSHNIVSSDYVNIPFNVDPYAPNSGWISSGEITVDATYPYLRIGFNNHTSPYYPYMGLSIFAIEIV